MLKDSIHRLMVTAVAHHQSGRLAEAAGIYRQVLTLSPRDADALHLLGLVLHQGGNHLEAASLIDRAIALRPKESTFYVNGAMAYSALGDLEKAAEYCRRAIALEPNLPEVHNNLGGIYRGLGLIDEAIASYRKAFELRPNYVRAHSNIVFAMNYLLEASPAEIYAAHVEWALRHADPMKRLQRPHGNSRAIDRPLRVGYVSPDFKQHAVAYFIEPVLARHDRERFSVTCYSDAQPVDAVTQRLKQYAAQWREVANLTDEQLADVVRRDAIDILVDLAGHTAGSRLLMFAQKPAPVQFTYLGYPATTGLAEIDYRITDGFADPPGMTEELHAEKLVRLPHSAWCYQPDASAPEVSALPALGKGYVTFGSFNNFAKVTPQALDVWAEILKRVPGSKLLIKARGMQQAGIQSRLHAHFARCGIGPERLQFHPGNTIYREHLGMYHDVDIALDTFPYNGTTTTCEASYMGVAVVTLAGKSHAQRVGVSLLSNLGLGELIADSPQRYIDIAVNLASDLRALAQRRAEMRDRFDHSPLRDAQSFTRDLEEIYLTAWKKWAGGAK